MNKVRDQIGGKDYDQGVGPQGKGWTLPLWRAEVEPRDPLNEDDKSA